MFLPYLTINLLRIAKLVKPVTDNFIVTFIFNYARDFFEIRLQKLMANFPGNIVDSARQETGLVCGVRGNVANEARIVNQHCAIIQSALPYQSSLNFFSGQTKVHRPQPVHFSES